MVRLDVTPILKLDTATKERLRASVKDILLQNMKWCHCLTLYSMKVLGPVDPNSSLKIKAIYGWHPFRAKNTTLKRDSSA